MAYHSQKEKLSATVAKELAIVDHVLLNTIQLHCIQHVTFSRRTLDKNKILY